MADIDPLDIEALESAVNDSALSVSTIWLSFLVFAVYLVATAASVTQSELLSVEGSINIPTVDIALPLVPSFIFLPLTLMIFHVYLLLQVLLLARTAAVYNEAVEKGVALPADSVRIRQRLANTLFAQLFAGSKREREGLPGILLRTIIWMTLIIAPVFVLLLFQLQFLAYHSLVITWIHRLLVLLDVVAIVVLWAGALEATQDISLRGMLRRWELLIAALGFVVLSLGVLSFPGEPLANLTRYAAASDPAFGGYVLADCRKRSVLASVLPRNFDRLSLPGVAVANDESVNRLTEIAQAKGKRPYEGERTGSFRGRDFRCANLAGADLRLTDFTGADMAGVNAAGSVLTGALFAVVQNPEIGIGAPPPDERPLDTNLEGAVLDGAQLEDSFLLGANLRGASLIAAVLKNAELSEASLDGANLVSANLQDARLERADLSHTQLTDGQLQRAYLREAKLNVASATNAEFQGATLILAEMQGSYFVQSLFQGARLDKASLQGARFMESQFQAAVLDEADARGADLYGADFRGASLSRTILHGARLDSAQLEGAVLTWAELQGSSLDHARLQGANMDQSVLTLANIAGANLWRADHLDCGDAQIIEPDLTPRLSSDSRAGSPGDTNLSPAVIEEFVGDSLASVPDGFDLENQDYKAIARDRMLTLLNPPPEEDRTESIAADWRACAAKAMSAEGYASKLADYLTQVACGAPEQPAIAQGIANIWIGAANVLDDGQTALARALLGLDGKSCPGAAGLSAETVESLNTFYGDPASQ